MKKCAFLLCFFTIGFNLWSESVFTLDARQDIILSSAALIAFFGHYLIDAEPTVPGVLGRSDVNFLDRAFMADLDLWRFEPARNAVHMGFLLAPWLASFAVTGFDMSDGFGTWFLRGFDTWFTYGVMYAQAFLFTDGITRTLKKVFNRYRPFVYLAGGSETQAFTTSSFPSGTTAMAFMPAAFLSTTFSAEHPDSPWRLPVIVGSYTLAASMGIFRMLNGEHFLTDVLAGAAIGSLIGWAIPTLHRRVNENNNGVVFLPTANGIIVSIRPGSR
ncbi:MAG: phosphatase PAP2 family protein [Spirochaetes bacterium]|nr:phosphatase PAP2 family protein [Spirochaetota bacterium]